MFTIKNSRFRLTRWRLKYDEYECEIYYKQWSSYNIADTLSQNKAVTTRLGYTAKYTETLKLQKLTKLPKLHKLPKLQELRTNQKTYDNKNFI